MLDWYSIAKYVHVMSAVAWVGGGLVLFFLGLLARRRNDEAASAQVFKQVVLLSPIWFIPISLVTLIAGVIMAFGYALWGQAWVVLGLLFFLATFSIGFFILKPTSEAVDAAEKAGRREDVKAGGEKMLAASKFDYTLMFVVIADMVMKPQWNDWPLLLIFVVVLGGAGYLYLYPMFKPKAAVA